MSAKASQEKHLVSVIFYFFPFLARKFAAVFGQIRLNPVKTITKRKQNNIRTMNSKSILKLAFREHKHEA